MGQRWDLVNGAARALEKSTIQYLGYLNTYNIKRVGSNKNSKNLRFHLPAIGIGIINSSFELFLTALVQKNLEKNLNINYITIILKQLYL